MIFIKSFQIFKNAKNLKLTYCERFKKIICYSNFDTDDNITPQLAIIDQTNEQIVHNKYFKDIILEITVSKCNNFFGVLLSNGEVIIYDTINYTDVTKFYFEEVILPVEINDDYGIRYDIEPHFLIIDFPNIFVGNKKILKIYS